MWTPTGFALASCPLGSSGAWRNRACKRRPRTCSRKSTCAQHAAAAPTYAVEVALWDELTASGAAFCIAPGEFLTCFHVIAHASKIFVNGRRAHLLRVCRAADVAVLACAPLADVALPHQLRDPGTLREIFVSRGGIHELPVMGLRNRWYASGATLPALFVLDRSGVLGPGDSGEPLFDARTGKVAGMFVATVSHTDDGGYALAVPATLLRHVLEGKRRVVRFGALPGLQVHSFFLPLVRAAAGVPSEIRGVRVVAGGERYGLREDDVLCEVDGAPISTETALSFHLARFAPGDLASFTIWRPDTGMMDASVRVGDAEHLTAAIGWAPGRVAVSANGFVFMVLSFEYLSRWGHNWHEKCPSELLRAALASRETGKGPKHVVVLAVAPDGYDELLHKTVDTVGGQKVTCLGDMVRFSRPAAGEKPADAVARLYGGTVVQIGACIIEEGRLDPRGIEEMCTS